MVTKNYFKIVVILILIYCQKLCAQLSFCNLHTAVMANNICYTPSSNYSVYIYKRVCEMCGDTNGWCILVDNRNREFDGQQMKIEMDNSFSVTWTGAIQTEPNSNSLELKLIIMFGINRIYFEPYSSLAPILNIKSFTINDHDVCQWLNWSNQPKLQVQNTLDEYQFLNDCNQRRNYTVGSERFCHNDGIDFIIEKRFFMRDERYWCIVINNENNVFSSANLLRISYSSQNKFVAWSPSEIYFKQNNDDSFSLGSSQTIVAISTYYGVLPDLTMVTIDGQSICNYFQPRRTTPLPSQFISILYQAPVNNTVYNILNTTAAPPYNNDTIGEHSKPSINTNCGITQSSHLPLIAFGETTNSGDWPWHAAIYKQSPDKNQTYICGGTLIDRKTIITAAHCIVDSTGLAITPDRIIVELGRNDLSSIATPGTQELKVFDVISHELYDEATKENDIAILVLANYVHLTTYVNFICLPEPNMNLQNQIGKVVGFGLDESNQLQTKLRKASMPVIDNMLCLSSNRNFFGKYLTSTNFCAGYGNNTNVCRGDSGSGLAFEIDNRWILGGITSLGVPSQSTELPCDLTQYSLFTDVTKFVKWIKQNF